MLFGREYLHQADHELSDQEIRELYGKLMEAFLYDFMLDAGYAVDILSHARMTEYKQQLWEVRGQVTKDEAEARRRCNIDHRDNNQFLCRNDSPCGFGHCPYAKSDNTFDTVPLANTSNKTPVKRPRSRAVREFYYMEEAMEAILVMRGVRSRRIT